MEDPGYIEVSIEACLFCRRADQLEVSPGYKGILYFRCKHQDCGTIVSFVGAVNGKEAVKRWNRRQMA